MLCRADAIGVFQVESRAQLSFLPRMRPRTVLRPGHRGGDRAPRPDPGRHGASLPAAAARARSRSTIPSDALGAVLGAHPRRAALPGAGDADRHRRRRLLAGRGRPAAPLARHLPRRRLGPQVPRALPRRHGGERLSARSSPSAASPRSRASASYGFPESHAASFALLVYASAWLKCHHPAVFACALLNSQPMGFYAPAQIVRDAREHGVVVRPVCVNASYWDNVLEPDGRGGLALRLGFRQIKAMRQDDADWIAAARGNGYPDVAAVWRRAGTPPRLLALLAEADAFACARARPPRGALAGGGDPRRGAAAALRRARGRGGEGPVTPAADDARRGDRRGLHRAPPQPARPPHGAAARPLRAPPSPFRGRARRLATEIGRMHCSAA